jgi:hypothetical protein
MKTIKKAKDFDCVRMKNEIQAKIYAETKDMTDEEILAYFNKSVVDKTATIPDKAHMEIAS